VRADTKGLGDAREFQSMGAAFGTLPL